MTTRRDVLTSLAALPITAATATGGAANAATVLATAAVLAEPEPPQFIHDIDQRLAREIDTMEQLLARMKDRLLIANHPNPMIRHGALLDMRCAFTGLSITADFVRETVETQRSGALADRRSEEVRHALAGTTGA